MAHAAEQAGGAERVDQIKSQTHEHIQNSIDLGNQVFGGFIHLFDRPPKRTTLPSR
jgi:hypothetical protein